MTAVSSYIAYARALNRLGWTPAEFAVAESFAVRLRGMLGRCPVAANGLPLVMAFPRCSSALCCCCSSSSMSGNPGRSACGSEPAHDYRSHGLRVLRYAFKSTLEE